MTKHVMIDLWTLGKGPEGAIMAIGAVKFDPFKPKADLEQFFQAIDPVSSEALGMKLHAASVMNWLGRENTLTEYSKRRVVDLATGIYGFSEWCGVGCTLWASDPVDILGLRRGYDLVGEEAPWSRERCSQTIISLADVIEAKARRDTDPLLNGPVSHVTLVQAVVKQLGLTRL